MADPEPPKYAHFENVEAYDLYDLYQRHGEVARDIHQDILRKFTDNDSLTVDLVRESPLKPETPGSLGSLERYDVVSVSTAVGLGSILHSSGIAGAETADLYKRAFAEEDMPIYIVAAGNNGLSRQAAMPRVADLARNSLVVGEANASKSSPYLEDHSSMINPTLASDNPFNRGVKYQMYDPSPSLVGHEDLVREWIIDQEVSHKLQELKDSDIGQVLHGNALGNVLRDAYRIFSDEVSAKYSEDGPGAAELQAKVDAYMAHPETLHTQVMAEIRKKEDVDANGYTSGVDGTSFSAPEQAGYVSGAMYEQSQREAKNLPILTKDEITTLAKMATIDTQAREGKDEPMHLYMNDDGQKFVYGAGHGVFQPEMFRQILDEAYHKIETTPDIDRDPVVTVMSGKVDADKAGLTALSVQSDLPDGATMVIDRLRVDMDYSVNGIVPHNATLTKPGEEEDLFYRLQLANKPGSIGFVAWARIESDFGETLSAGQSWKLGLMGGRDAQVQDATITAYGYNQGGLMDQMMDYSKDLATKMTTPAPPEVAPDTDITPDVQSKDGLNAPQMPR